MGWADVQIVWMTYFNEFLQREQRQPKSLFISISEFLDDLCSLDMGSID